ncbi:hypothetical protein ACW5F0_11195 [Luteimonas sp. A534]
MEMWFNNASEAVELSCTGVSGFQTGTGATHYIVKSVLLPASGAQNVMRWNAVGFPGAPALFPTGLFSVSCALAPGVRSTIRA